MPYITDVLHFLVDSVDRVAEANRGELHAAVDKFLGWLREHDPEAPAAPAPAPTQDDRIAELEAELAKLKADAK